MATAIKLTYEEAQEAEFRLAQNARNQQASLDDLLAQRATRVSLRHSIKQFDAKKHGGIALQVNSDHLTIANTLYGTTRGQAEALAEFKAHDKKPQRMKNFTPASVRRMRTLAAKIADQA